MYADDSTVTVASSKISDIRQTLNNELSAISNWCNMNMMALNINKTKSMLITTSRKRQNLTENLDISLNGETLEAVNHEKLLGVIVDDNLTWRNQVSSVCGKLSRSISLLRRIKQYLDDDTRRMYYMAYVQPHIDYCLTIWGQSSELHRVRKLQNLALRVIADQPRRTSSLPLFKQFRIMPVDDLVAYRMTALVFKSVNGLAPEYLADMFISVDQAHERQTRASTNGDLMVPRYRLKARQNTLAVKGAGLYNECDTSIRNQDTILSFKNSYCRSYFAKL